uniref:MADF domain-containing protein n=1 Tax=Amblyomma maculatum TaxID=34609 RepID=G3MKL9_AMBMU
MALPSSDVSGKKRTARATQRMEYNDRLIAAVQKRPVLWDHARSDHKDYRMKHTVWMEVRREVGKDPEGSTVQARWKGLRDTFVKKHKTWVAATAGNSSAQERREIRWPYFKMLMFLKDQVDVGGVTSNSQPIDGEQDSASSILLHICNDSEGSDGSDDEDEADEKDEAPTSSSPYGRVPSQATPSSATSNSLAPRKRGKEKVKSPPDDPDEEADKHSEESDSECALFGKIVARKMRACPKRLRTDLQIELFEVLKRYEHQ